MRSIAELTMTPPPLHARPTRLSLCLSKIESVRPRVGWLNFSIVLDIRMQNGLEFARLNQSYSREAVYDRPHSSLFSTLLLHLD